MTPRASNLPLWAAVAVLLAPPVQARQVEPAQERIPITDPWLLESLGLEPDAANVYATQEVYEQMLMSPAERTVVSQLEAEEAALLEAESASTLGRTTSASGFGQTAGVSTILGTDFAPLDSSTDYVLLGSGTQMTCRDGIPFFRGVFADLPHGARATVLRIWFQDDHIDDLTAWLERTCFPFFSAGAPETTILRMNESSGTPGWGRFGPGALLEEDIDSQSCVYAIRVRLGDSNLDCTTGNDLGIAKASLSWQRQVSSAPGTPTFDDVPTTHPFYQHIEALAAAGISDGGCEPNRFCPNAVLTRSQIAALLVEALGLGWGAPFWEP